MHPHNNAETRASANEQHCDAGDQFDPETLYDCLSHRYRRYVLVHLLEREQPVALADLAREIAEWDYDTPLAEIPVADVSRIHTALYHVHVPKLGDADIVRYNASRDTVGLAERGESLDKSLVTGRGTFD